MTRNLALTSRCPSEDSALKELVEKKLSGSVVGLEGRYKGSAWNEDVLESLVESGN